MTMNAFGKLCGNKPLAFQVATESDNAPTVVYIIRDTEI
jgi:hypothetical protein